MEDCPAYGDLHVVAFQRYLFLRGDIVAPDGGTGDAKGFVFVQVQRYSATDAGQVMTDARRVVQACARYTTSTEASSELHPAHAIVDWTITGSDFAGDQSLLVRQRVTSVDDATGATVGDVLVESYATVRVGDLVATLQVSAENPTLLKGLAKKAAERLCVAAVPACRR
jgi:hypothetical protein